MKTVISVEIERGRRISRLETITLDQMLKQVPFETSMRGKFSSKLLPNDELLTFIYDNDIRHCYLIEFDFISGLCSIIIADSFPIPERDRVLKSSSRIHWQ